MTKATFFCGASTSLLATLALVAMSCLQEGGPCVNACRAMVACATKGSDMSRDTERSLVDECLLTCRREYWADAYTDCLTKSNGDCKSIASCTYETDPPDASVALGRDTASEAADALCDIPCAETRCYFDNLYCFDNCGNPGEMVQACEFGCDDGACIGCTATDDCAREECYQGDLYCYDDCGVRADVAEACPAGCARDNNQCNDPERYCEEGKLPITGTDATGEEICGCLNVCQEPSDCETEESCCTLMFQFPENNSTYQASLCMNDQCNGWTSGPGNTDCRDL